MCTCTCLNRRNKFTENFQSFTENFIDILGFVLDFLKGGLKDFEDFVQDFEILGDFRTKRSDLEDLKRLLRSKGFHRILQEF